VDTPLRILVADDSQTDRMLLSSILARQGHDVVTAVDGLDALARFESDAPQMVLLDVLMPRLDGVEVAKRIKSLAAAAFVPIIFLSSITDADELARCLDAGGDDFLSKPYNGIVLRAKIAAFERMRQLHLAVQASRDELQRHHARLLTEQNTAKAIFDRVAHSGCLDASNIRHLISPVASFNGDVLLAARAPAGNMHVFLGDFTGHGLPASIGAMPLAELFYSMTAKGFPMADILREANRKLCDVLPTGFFCCAAMANLDFRRGSVDIWNGGLPAVYLIRSAGNHVEQVASMHLPLGLLAPSRFRVGTVVRELVPSDRVLMCTDGIVEARDPAGNAFGTERLKEILARPGAADHDIAEIRRQLALHVRDQTREDDYSLVDVVMVPVEQVSVAAPPPDAMMRGATDWTFDYQLQGASLARFNPLPLLQQILMEVPGLRPRGGEIFAVLSELYSNALDHGVMGLESTSKQSSEGFDDYYRLRTQALAQLDGGWIRFRCASRSSGNGGSLQLRVNDSGPGFDHRNYLAAECRSAMMLHGRGLRLVMSLCDSILFHECGNDVEVVFCWGDAAGGARSDGAGVAALLDGGGVSAAAEHVRH
jgi:two-component system, HptB-dependent secretion and biofilm response regulator